MADPVAQVARAALEWQPVKPLACSIHFAIRRFVFRPNLWCGQGRVCQGSQQLDAPFDPALEHSTRNRTRHYVLLKLPMEGVDQRADQKQTFTRRMCLWIGLDVRADSRNGPAAQQLFAFERLVVITQESVVELSGRKYYSQPVACYSSGRYRFITM
jgi:hypothetical protein